MSGSGGHDDIATPLRHQMERDTGTAPWRQCELAFRHWRERHEHESEWGDCERGYDRGDELGCAFLDHHQCADHVAELEQRFVSDGADGAERRCDGDFV